MCNNAFRSSSKEEGKSLDRKEGTELIIVGRRFKDGGKRHSWRTRSSWGNVVNQQRCAGSVRTERQVALGKKRGPAGVRRLLSRRGRFLRPFPTRGANITPGVTDSRCPFSSTVRATARHKTTPPHPTLFERSVSPPPPPPPRRARDLFLRF